jgi:hypothetical protein
VAWITRAEIYFDVQNTADDHMRVKLARLSIEGATIQWFNLLMETEDELTCDKLKKSLIEELSTLFCSLCLNELFPHCQQFVTGKYMRVET